LGQVNYLVSIFFCVKKTLKKCAGVIVLGNNLKYLFQDYFVGENIFVIPNGGNYKLQTKTIEELTVLYLGFAE
jgi:hypothetical protein